MPRKAAQNFSHLLHATMAMEAEPESFKMGLALDLVRAVQARKLPPAVMGTASRQSTNAGEIYFTIDLEDPTQGREIAHLLASFLKENHPAFVNASPPIFAEVSGIRETPRWSGDYLLTETDLVEGHSFPDTVARAAWPIELRETTKGPRLKYFKNLRSLEIPLRALMTSKIPGVFFAGRCLSATHVALASVRVMGTCFATGQAAGTAASMHARNITPTSGLIVGQIKHL
jgi:hypothetical protein